MIPTYISLEDSVQDSLSLFLNNKTYTKIGVLMDENTRKYCYPLIENTLPSHTNHTIPSGEAEKTIATCKDIWEWMTDQNLDRRSLLINLGGGVVCDMGGFCAACFKRGIDFIHIPTTLLAQVDASIGGKLGVDFNSFKNHIGIFRLPGKVCIDSTFLKTLPTNQTVSGFAEVIKHGLIYDKEYFKVVQKIIDLDTVEWNSIIERSLEIKSDIVSKDPEEKGLRKILNFGHTIGHAVETSFLEGQNEELLHGEAVAIGMICESYISTRETGLSRNAHNSIVDLIQKFFKKKSIENLDLDRLLTNVGQDKKNEDKRLMFTLLTDVGKSIYDVEIGNEEVIGALEYYKGLYN